MGGMFIEVKKLDEIIIWKDYLLYWKVNWFTSIYFQVANTGIVYNKHF